MTKQVIPINRDRHHKAVDLGSQAPTPADRRDAYRASLQPDDNVQEALIDVMAAVQTRLHELPDFSLIDDEEFILRDAFYDAMKAFRKLQRLTRKRPAPDGPRKAA